MSGVRLGTGRWRLWPDVALRSAGFPADLVTALHDDELAYATDTAATAPGYPDLHRAGLERQSRALETISGSPRFREAVAWQNPQLVRDCLDRLDAGKPRNARRRGHELTVAGHVQRYALKNDTIGFFGPVGWAALCPGRPGCTAVPGPALLARRTTYFESWAIDELARALAAAPGMSEWLKPVLASTHLLGDGVIHRPRQSPIPVGPAEGLLLRRCDGLRTVRDLAGELSGVPGGFPDAAAVRSALERFRVAQVLRMDLEQPVQTWPERALRRRLLDIGDAAVRDRALATLDELCTARDIVAAGSGEPDKVLAGFAVLDDTFRRITGTAATRRAGRTYAGRTLVYQDTVRDVRVELGRPVLDALAEPLSLVLDGARWLVHHIAEGYRGYFLDLHTRRAARTGTAEVPLAQLVGAAAGELTASRSGLPALVTEAVTEFQRRWQEVLRLPDGVRAFATTAEAIRSRAGRAFGDAGVPWWSAGHHSPDLMLAATSADAVSRGEFLVVLGELHLAFNSLESRLFVEQHPEPGRLRAAVADRGGRRIYAVLPKSSPFVTSRLAPPSALLTADDTFWSWAPGADSVTPPGPIRPAAELLVRRAGDRLVVGSRTTADEFDFIETIGEILSGAVVNAFRPFADAAHRPRVTIDRLVLARESWTFPAPEVAWAFAKDERDRFTGARAWRRDQSMPELVFVKLPVEDKPVAVDFTSPVLVDALAKAVRRTARTPGPDVVACTELLPGLDQLWLTDADGKHYTSEFRFVATCSTQ